MKVLEGKNRNPIRKCTLSISAVIVFSAGIHYSSGPFKSVVYIVFEIAIFKVFLSKCFFYNEKTILILGG